MKKKNETKYFFIVLIVAVIDILYGTFFQINKYQYQKNTQEVIANIHQITNNKKTNTLYIDYYVNRKLYNGVITTNNKTITINNRLKIYYNKDNPKEYTDGTISNAGYYMMAIGIIILLIDYKVFLSKKNVKKLKKKK